MGRSRLEAFSDGVFAIIITIMVLEFKVPHHPTFEGLLEIAPKFYTYALSYIYIGIYWNNHHHMIHTVERTNGGILWANLFLLFWLSLFPFGRDWIDESGFAALPTAVYGCVLLLAAISYQILQTIIIASHGSKSLLATAVGADIKGKISPALYAASIALAFVNPWISQGLFLAVAIIWLVPDKRIERVMSGHTRS